jgi:hypothetical protein
VKVRDIMTQAAVCCRPDSNLGIAVLFHQPVVPGSSFHLCLRDFSGWDARFHHPAFRPVAIARSLSDHSR